MYRTIVPNPHPDPDPYFFGFPDLYQDPLVTDTDPRIRIRIRIRTKMSRISNTVERLGETSEKEDSDPAPQF
jgi:hypothetical protein